ncbi:hypothetical protein CBOM_05673 [Ceraceosorus bombacis]|uniref:Uncharacterized protein n=1 Tax=Ceraceosorus bombacis TaxID=401625 RepID=A0A0P1BR81_9BASI|nr:hypothetical protein CBOM_05673 [Ceraceosorus bombacis]
MTERDIAQHHIAAAKYYTTGVGVEEHLDARCYPSPQESEPRERQKSFELSVKVSVSECCRLGMQRGEAAESEQEQSMGWSSATVKRRG